MTLIDFLVRLIKTFPCVAAFMSSLTIVGVALDRLRKKLLTKNSYYYSYYSINALLAWSLF